jgi:hypothetical protein
VEIAAQPKERALAPVLLYQGTTSVVPIKSKKIRALAPDALPNCPAQQDDGKSAGFQPGDKPTLEQMRPRRSTTQV